MSEKTEELEGQLASVSQEAHMWKSLTDHPAWEFYIDFLEKQRRMRAEVCMVSPITNEYTTYAQEYMKGEWNGLGVAISLPQTQLELAEMKRRTLTKELEVENAVEKEVESDVSRVIDDNPFGE